MKVIIIAFACIVLFTVLSCTESTTSPPDKPSISISGNIKNTKNLEVPGDAKVAIVWQVFAGSPDYEYFWGEGTIDYSNMSFKIELNDSPPYKAINDFLQFSLGGGYIVLHYQDKIYGMVNDRAILYFKGDYKNSEARRFWYDGFNEGYSMAKGVYVANNEGFDGWEYVNESSFELIIDDDPEAFKMPDWF